MGKKMVLFGAGQIAEIAQYYFKNDSDFDVVAFSVDSEFVTDDSFCGLPVVPSTELSNTFSPGEFSAFIAISYSKLNEIRKAKYLELKNLGYKLENFISSKANIAGNVKFGDNCFVFEDNTVQPFVSIGNNVTLWSGNHVGHHSIIEDHNFIASHAVISGGVKIKESCFIGVNATLRDHITIGDKCVIGAGALILSDAEPGGLYKGSATERSQVPTSKLKNI